MDLGKFRLTSIEHEKISQISDISLDLRTKKLITTSETCMDLFDTKTGEIHSNLIDTMQEEDSLFLGKAEEKKEQKKLQKKLPIVPFNNTNLRFVPINSGSKLIISPSGLIVTANDQEENQIAITNYGFSKGEPYWEILCPLSCANIAVGVITEGFNPKNPVNNVKLMEVNEFRTTTPRVIGVKLDFEKKKINFWLNGILQPSKQKNIQADKVLYPCVKIKGKGNMIVLNPFVVDIERTFNYLNYNVNAEKYFLEKNKNKKSFELIVQEEQEAVNGIKLSLKNIDEMLKNPQITLQVNKGKDIKSFYLEKGDNLILMQEDKLKLIRRDTSQQFNADLFSFQKILQRKKDVIGLKISRKDIELLITLLDWQTFLAENYFKGKNEYFRCFLNALESGLKFLATDNIVFVRIRFDAVKIVLGELANYLRCIISKTKQESKKIPLIASIKPTEEYIEENQALPFCPIFEVPEVCHFLETDKELDLTNLNFLSSLSLQLPNNRMLESLPSTNIPLYETINNLPIQTHKKTVQNCEMLCCKTLKNCSYFCTVSTDGAMNIWNGELILFRVFASNFKEESACEKVELFPLEEESNDGFEGFGLFDDPPEKKVEKKDPEVIPNPSMIEALYSMGFPVDLAKKALIQVKNAGVPAAVDVILELEKEIKESNVQAKVVTATTLLRPKWQCEVCTLININGNKNCEVCQSPAPLNAYYTEEELREEDKKIKVEEEKEDEPKTTEPEKKKSPEEERAEMLEKFFKDKATLAVDAVLIRAEESRSAGIVGGIIFENNESDTIIMRLRRFGFHYNYLKRFSVQDNTETVSLIEQFSHGWVTRDTLHHLEDLLFAEQNRLAIEVLEPVFSGNNRVKNLQEASKSLFNTEWQVLDQIDFEISLKNCYSVAWKKRKTKFNDEIFFEKTKEEPHSPIKSPTRKKKEKSALILKEQLPAFEKNCGLVEEFDLAVLGRDVKGVVVRKFVISVASDNPYKEAETVAVQEKIVFIENDIVVSNRDEIVFLSEEGNILKIENVGFEIKEIKELADGSFAVLDAMKKNCRIINGEEKTEEKEKEKEFEKEELPELEKMSENEILSLRNLLRMHPVGSSVKENEDFRVVSSQKEFLFNEKLFTKHGFYRNLKRELKEETVFEISFEKKKKLSKITMEFMLDFLISEINKKEVEQEIQEETVKKIEETDEDFKGLGLPVFSLGETDPKGDTNKYIPLRVHSFKGASYNNGIKVSRLLFPNQHLQEKRMVIESVTVMSEINTKNGGYPIGSGLIFTAEHPSFFELTKSFHNMQPGEYTEWLKKRRGVEEIQPWEPVGCFSLEEKAVQVTVELDYKRSARFVMVRPTSMRSKPNDYSNYFNSSPIEIKFIGFKGNAIENEIPIEKSSDLVMKSSIGFEKVLNKIKLDFNVGTKEKPNWKSFEKGISEQAIALNEKIFAESFKEPINESWRVFIDYPLKCCTKLELSLSNSGEDSVCGVRIRYPCENLEYWSFSGLSIQMFCADDSTFKNASVIRNALLEISAYEQLNKQLVKIICEKGVLLEKKKAASKLLSDIMSVKPNIVLLVFKDLDLLSYLCENVLVESDSTFLNVFSFLKYFVKLEGFAHSLLKSLFVLLPMMVENKVRVTSTGLKGYFCLLIWCHHLDLDKTFCELLEQLMNVCQKIKETRSKDYNLLRAKYEIPALSFEKELFSNENIFFEGKGTSKKTSSVLSDKKNLQKPVKSRFFTRKMSFGREIFVDLMNETDVTDIWLAIEKNNNACKLNFTIWALNPNESNRIREFDLKMLRKEYFKEDLWMQLSNYGDYLKDFPMFFKADEPMECIGVSRINQRTRFLLVHIYHTFQPAIRMSNENVPGSFIVPLVFGRSCEEKKEKMVYKFEKELFENNEAGLVPKNEYKIGNFETFQVYSLKNNNNIHFFDSTGKLKKAEDKGESIEKKLYQLRGESATGQRENIINLCQDIEHQQLQLLALQNDSEKINVSSLDFLYTLAIKISQCIRKIDSDIEQIGPNKKTWRQNEWIQGSEGRKICLELFEVFIVFESPVVKQASNTNCVFNEILALLTDVLVDNLNEREWQLFLINITKRFLAKPISLATSPIEELFSHTRIIEALDKISIPDGEMLTYLAQQLGIVFNTRTKSIEIPNVPSPFLVKNALKRPLQQEVSETLCLLSSMLILLINGFKKIPVEGHDPKKVLHKGSYCFNCEQNKPISGLRQKCLNCPNLDCCANPVCEQKHLLAFPNHVFLQIEEPLPLTPEIQIQSGELTSLATPFTFVEPKTDNHIVSCDNCANNIVGVRMMCGNCEEYSLCKNCYEKKVHTKYHVFIKLDSKTVPPSGTPKCLFQLLDPRLYPLKLPTTEEGSLLKKFTKGAKRELSKNTQTPLSAIPLQRSISHPVRDENLFSKKNLRFVKLI